MRIQLNILAIVVVTWTTCFNTPARGAERTSPLIIAFENAPQQTQADRWNAGRLLVGELNCVACHRADEAVFSHLNVKAAPDLSDVGSRVNVDYLRRYLSSPHTTKPGVTMPDVLHLGDARTAGNPDETVESLLHYLMSQRDAKAKTKVWPRGDGKRGRQLYHTVGCVACHAPDKDYEPVLPKANSQDDGDAFDGDANANRDPNNKAASELPPIKGASISLGDPGKKNTLNSLAAFLHDPLKVRPSGRMPHMKLSEQEAMDIAVYLHPTREQAREQNSKQPNAFRVDEQKANVGAAIFSRRRCFACHTMRNKGEGRIKPAPPLAALANKQNTGCLAINPAPQPDYKLSDAQRTAINTFLAALPSKRASDALRAERTLIALNCIACHQRGTVGNNAGGQPVGGPEPGRAAYFQPVKELDLGDEGRLPPPLTGIGRKLQPQAFADVLAGKPGADIRPYIATRMPIFGEVNVKHLPAGLAAADIPAGENKLVFDGNDRFARNRYGRELLGKTGMSCITCHNLAGHKSIGIPAMDLAAVPQRLRPEWYRDFMIDPTKFRPGVRMPSFFPNGKSVNTRVLRGDVTGQLGAIWRYLKEVEQTRLPIGMEKTDAFVLTPKDEPIVLRTFMKGAGTHAIAVGYPEGLHFAFDADEVRPALAWRGKFVDAVSTWDDRFTPWTVPLGKDVIALSAGPSLAVLRSETDAWPSDADVKGAYTFKGYRLDEKRRPVFAYTFGEVNVEESIMPIKHEDGLWLRRTLVLKGKGKASNLWFRALHRDAWTTANLKFFLQGKQTSVRAKQPEFEKWKLRTIKGFSELLVPIEFIDGKAMVELEVKWFK